MEGLYLRKWDTKLILLYTVRDIVPCNVPCNFQPPSQGHSNISDPDIYSIYNDIGVYLEGLYLRKWDAKHILLCTVGDLAPSSVP
jgi:hypothetical protein